MNRGRGPMWVAPSAPTRRPGELTLPIAEPFHRTSGDYLRRRIIELSEPESQRRGDIFDQIENERPLPSLSGAGLDAPGPAAPDLLDRWLTG